MEKGGFVYLLASRRNGTLYIGVTSDLTKRISQHRDGRYAGFTHRYSVHMLVWFEVHSNIEVAIRREKAMEEWHRAWKVRLIEERNPHRSDRSVSLGFPPL